MEDAKKGDLRELLGEPVHIVDFGFIKNDTGDYGVIQLEERPGMFYFCNQVITDMLHQVDADGMREGLKGEAITFTLAKSKNGRDYFRFSFGEDVPF